MELPKQYDIKKSEQKWKKFWEDNKIYAFNPESDKEVYSIDTPPPTVSGKMHIGHAFSYSQQDFIARYQRMKGKNVFYPFGTDDNGLPTERLIEKMKNVKATKMQRSDFVKLCYNTISEIRNGFVQDWKDIGMCCDFDVFYSTIDPNSVKISQTSFIELYKIGREYRKRTPFMWCPLCQTAIAQVEMKDKESKSKFVYMKFDTSPNEQITIATTRPEMMAACVAIHIHPNDRRYKKFIGAKAKIPFYSREVEITSNKDVDMEFGSGIVYHCTFGDMDDAKWMEEFKIKPIEIMNKDGTLNEKAGKYKGMKAKDAREAIIKDLEKDGRIEKIEEIVHVVNTHDKCETEIEILMTEQWFIKYMDLKEKFLKSGKEIKWYPEHMVSRYNNWVQGLKWDWCISRQRHFGVPFPVWYCKKCNEIILADIKDLPVDPLTDSPKKKCKCGSNEFIPEKDVMDTWATSSLTPQIAAELFKGKQIFKKLYPMSLRPQAHDIITFWLFNTVVKSQLHNNVNPWHNIMISGWALDPHGKKMSKSKGNVVEPRDVLEKYGADCLRFWAATSKLGEDVPYQEKDLVTGRKFIVKLWNAFNFSHLHLKDYKKKRLKKEDMELVDLYILSKLSRIIKLSTDSFDEYEFFRTKIEVENFFWHTFCDNYLEIIKDRIYNPDKRGAAAKESAQYALYYSLFAMLKLIAPIMPFITEEIYQSYFIKYEKDKSIHLSKWPEFNKTLVDEKIENIGDVLVYAIESSRKAKTEKSLSLKAPVKKMVLKAKITKNEFEMIKQDLIGATKAQEIIFEELGKDSKTEQECIIDL